MEEVGVVEMVVVVAVHWVVLLLVSVAEMDNPCLQKGGREDCRIEAEEQMEGVNSLVEE